MAKTSVIKTVQAIIEIAQQMCSDGQICPVSELIRQATKQTGVPLGEQFTLLVIETNGFVTERDDQGSRVFRAA